MALFGSLSRSLSSIPPGGLDQLRQGAALLESSGDAATARYIRQQMAQNGLA